MAMTTIEHPHSAHDRTKEWRSCCMEVSMGRDPRWQRLAVVDDSSDGDHYLFDNDDDDEEEDGLFGCWSSPGYLAINMIDDNDPNDDEHDKHANIDSWMRAALTLSASIDEVSLMIQRKAASYVSSTDTLNICFNNGKNNTSTERTMTNADRSILETTVASFAAGMAKQLDSLRRTVVVEGDHPFIKTADDNGNTDTAPSHHWASGPIGHRAGIASCLMQRLKSEIMDPMTRLQSQSKKKNNAVSGDAASEIAQNPMRMFRLEGNSMRRPPPPAPWEVGGHDAEKDRAERRQEKDEFLSIYFEDKEKPDVTSAGDIASNMMPPPSVIKFLDLPKPSLTIRQQQQPTQNIPSTRQAPQQNTPPPPYEEEERIDQLQRESAQILATYQHSDLEGVQKVESSMVEICQLLSNFTDLITEQQEDVFQIHDQALKSKENVDKGQDQLVDAANRGEKSKHPMASFISVMALLLLFFNYLLP